MLDAFVQFMMYPPLYALRIAFVLAHILFFVSAYVTWRHQKYEDLPFRCMITFFSAAGSVALAMAAVTVVTGLAAAWQYVLTGL